MPSFLTFVHFVININCDYNDTVKEKERKTVSTYQLQERRSKEISRFIDYSLSGSITVCNKRLVWSYVHLHMKE